MSLSTTCVRAFLNKDTYSRMHLVEMRHTREVCAGQPAKGSGDVRSPPASYLQQRWHDAPDYCGEDPRRK
jgi:hypothetical protein